MDEEIKDIYDYEYRYKEFKGAAAKIIEAIENIIAKDDRLAERVSKTSREDLSITFQFCGFRIKISLIVKVMEDLGYLRWYYIYFNEEEQKNKGELVSELYFNHVGDIFEDKSKKTPLYSAKTGIRRFFPMTLFAVCKVIESGKLIV